MCFGSLAKDPTAAASIVALGVLPSLVKYASFSGAASGGGIASSPAGSESAGNLSAEAAIALMNLAGDARQQDAVGKQAMPALTHMLGSPVSMSRERAMGAIKSLLFKNKRNKTAFMMDPGSLLVCSLTRDVSRGSAVARSLLVLQNRGMLPVISRIKLCSSNRQRTCHPE